MTTETIFDGVTAPEVPPTVALPTEVAELVGEGKKYKTAEDALKALPFAQKHIQTIEEENARMKEELTKRKTAEELLEEFKVSGVLGGNRQVEIPSTANMDVEAIVASVLAKKEAQTTAQKNISVVVDTFQKAFGDKVKAEEMYNKVAEESGLSIAALNNLAATSPEAVMRLAGITKKQVEDIPGKVQGTVNSQGFPEKPNTELSARLKPGASTKDMVNAWRIAREKVIQQFN